MSLSPEFQGRGWSIYGFCWKTPGNLAKPRMMRMDANLAFMITHRGTTKTDWSQTRRFLMGFRCVKIK